MVGSGNTATPAPVYLSTSVHSHIAQHMTKLNIEQATATIECMFAGNHVSALPSDIASIVIEGIEPNKVSLAVLCCCLLLML